MDDILVKTLFGMAGTVLGFFLGIWRDKVQQRRKTLSDTVERYIGIAEKEPFHDREAYRITGMLRAGVPLLKDEKEINEFFRLVTGRGHAHPWKSCFVNNTLPQLPSLTYLRALTEDNVIFAKDADIYEHLLSTLTRKDKIQP